MVDDKGLFREIDGDDTVLERSPTGGFVPAEFETPEVEQIAREAGREAITGDITPVETVRRRRRRRRVVTPVVAPAPRVVEPVRIEPVIVVEKRVISPVVQAQIRAAIPIPTEATRPRLADPVQFVVPTILPPPTVRAVTDETFEQRATRLSKSKDASLIEKVGGPVVLFGAGFVRAGQETIRTKGLNILEGTTEFILAPVSTLRRTVQRAKETSIPEVAGEIAFFSVVGKAGPKVVSKSVRTIRSDIFEGTLAKLERRATGEPTMFDRTATIEPIRFAPRVREPLASELARLDPAQIRFFEPVRTERVVTESGIVLTRKIPTPAEILSRRSILLEEAKVVARAKKPSELQTTIVPLKPEFEVIIPSKAFNFRSTRGLFLGKKGQVNIFRSKPIIEKPTREFVGVPTPAVSRVRSSPFFAPLTLDPTITPIVSSKLISSSIIDVAKKVTPISKLDTITKITPIERFVPVLDVLPIVRTRTKRKLATIVIPRTDFASIVSPVTIVEPVVPRFKTPLTTPFIPSQIRAKPLTRREVRRREAISKVRDLPKGFEVFVKRFGKEKTIATGLGRVSALTFGAERVRRTLGVTFGITPTGRPARVTRRFGALPTPSEFRTFRIVKGKRVPLVDTFIERRGKRLSTRGETKEIQFFKKKKSKGGGFF